MSLEQVSGAQVLVDSRACVPGSHRLTQEGLFWASCLWHCTNSRVKHPPSVSVREAYLLNMSFDFGQASDGAYI